MTRTLRAFALLSLLFASTFAFAAETGKFAENQSPVPEEGKALVIFIRSSFVGSAISASVYDAPETETKFIGIIQNKQRVAYQAEPGAHRFMVIAENADFADATLEAGKTYYVLVSPRMGMWKARFSLLPVRTDATAELNTQSEDFKKWMANTSLVDATDKNLAWYEKTKASIEEKKTDYSKKWAVMLPADKAELTINPQDGA